MSNVYDKDGNLVEDGSGALDWDDMYEPSDIDNMYPDANDIRTALRSKREEIAVVILGADDLHDVDESLHKECFDCQNARDMADQILTILGAGPDKEDPS